MGLGRARSRFAYAARNEDELSFEACRVCQFAFPSKRRFLQRGVEITIESENELDPGWWRGRLPDGRVGALSAC